MSAPRAEQLAAPTERSDDTTTAAPSRVVALEHSVFGMFELDGVLVTPNGLRQEQKDLEDSYDPLTPAEEALLEEIRGALTDAPPYMGHYEGHPEGVVALGIDHGEAVA